MSVIFTLTSKHLTIKAIQGSDTNLTLLLLLLPCVGCDNLSMSVFEAAASRPSNTEFVVVDIADSGRIEGCYSGSPKGKYKLYCIVAAGPKVSCAATLGRSKLVVVALW